MRELLTSLQAVVIEYPVTHLRVPKRMIEFDDETQARIDREDARMALLYRVESGPPIWTHAWQAPVGGAVTDPFGTRRTINGTPVPPHTGLDQRGKAGSPVRAPAPGRVLAIELLYIRGNVVVIDHGGGVFTTYAHLEGADVTIGQLVAMGDRIGRIGKTGRVTGPHLHWEVHIRGTRVDPTRMLDLAH